VSPDATRTPVRVGVIGKGAIGGTVARLLERGMAPGCIVSGVLVHRSTAHDLDALLRRSDLVVEAAGHRALASHGPVVTGSGVDLLVVSVGALVDDDLRARLAAGGSGRLLLSSGAIGGLDLLRAASLMGPLTVTLESTKRPEVLLRPWMDERLVRELEAGRDRVEAFTGSAREAAVRFPESANVAATLGLATAGLDETRVTVIGDPEATSVHHVIRAAGPAGAYEISIENRPSPQNPRTSAITPYAVLRALRDLRAGAVVGI
jgi:aspartate dehydrogenase